MTCKEPASRLARWIIRLNNFTFRINKRQGRLHGNADALSRWPMPEAREKLEEDEEFAVYEIETSDEVDKQFSIFNAKEQYKDLNLKWIIDVIDGNSVSEQATNDVQSALLKIKDQLHIINGSFKFIFGFVFVLISSQGQIL
jgi:hypothetical protein